MNEVSSVISVINILLSDTCERRIFLVMFRQMMKALNEEELISGGQLARKMGVDPATIRRWRRDEGAPFYQAGHNLIRFKFTEVQAWRANRPKVVRSSAFKPKGMNPEAK
jgi:excisionase family DNA binding protein